MSDQVGVKKYWMNHNAYRIYLIQNEKVLKINNLIIFVDSKKLNIHNILTLYYPDMHTKDKGNDKE